MPNILNRRFNQTLKMPHCRKYCWKQRDKDIKNFFEKKYICIDITLNTKSSETHFTTSCEGITSNWPYSKRWFCRRYGRSAILLEPEFLQIVLHLHFFYLLSSYILFGKLIGSRKLQDKESYKFPHTGEGIDPKVHFHN